MRIPTRTRRLPFAPLVVVLFLCVLPALDAARQAQAPADVIAKVKAQVAPDTRLAVFDVKAEPKDGTLEVSGEVDQPAAREAVIAALRAAGQAAITDRIVVLPDTALGAKHYGVVTVSVAVQKTKPSMASELGNQLVMGMPVKVLKRESGWYNAQSLDDRYLGWMEPEHVALMTKEELDAFRASRRFVVTTIFTVIREQAADDAAGGQRRGDGQRGAADRAVERLGRGAAAGRQAGLRPVNRGDGIRGLEGVAAADTRGDREDRAPVRRRPLPVGRHVGQGFRLLRLHQDGVPRQRVRAAARHRPAGEPGRGGRRPRTTSRNCARATCCSSARAPGVTRITHVGIYLGDKRFIHCAGKVKFNSFDPASPIYSESLLGRLVKVRRMGRTD